MAGQSKRREKYARREDAIVDAIELEKEQIEQLKTAYVGTGGKKSKLKGKQKSVDGGGDQPKKGNGDTSGVNRKVSKKKAQNAKDREASDFEDGAALLPRMRGLQDLVSAGTSSKITTVEGLDGSSEVEAPPLDDNMQQTVPEQAKALKRKRSAGRAEEAPSKRRDRKRPILQVLETLERDNENQDDRVPKAEGVCEGEDKLSDECESTQETLQLVSPAQDKPAAHFLDAHSASYNSKDVAVVACEGTTLPSHTSASPTGIQQEEKPPPARKEKGSKKKASTPPRTLASLVVDTAGDVHKATKQRKDPSVNLTYGQVLHHLWYEQVREAAGIDEASEGAGSFGDWQPEPRNSREAKAIGKAVVASDVDDASEASRNSTLPEVNMDSSRKERRRARTLLRMTSSGQMLESKYSQLWIGDCFLCNSHTSGPTLSI